MRLMPVQVRCVYDAEMYDVRGASGDAKWVHLERAHIASQPYLRQHARTHIAMFAVAFRQRDSREAAGQFLQFLRGMCRPARQSDMSEMSV